jgi:hypothetical protein
VNCEKCGAPLAVGDFPFCPHGRGSFTITPDEWPGGKTFENLGHTPVKVRSRSELKREMKARGLQECVRHVGERGSDRSKNTQRFV